MLLRIYVKLVLGIPESQNLPFTLEAQNFDFYEFLHLLKDTIYQINQIQSPKNGSFRTSWFSKIDFTENLTDRKILKFSFNTESTA